MSFAVGKTNLVKVCPPKPTGWHTNNSICGYATQCKQNQGINLKSAGMHQDVAMSMLIMQLCLSVIDKKDISGKYFTFMQFLPSSSYAFYKLASEQFMNSDVWGITEKLLFLCVRMYWGVKPKLSTFIFSPEFNLKAVKTNKIAISFLATFLHSMRFSNAF